MQNVRYLLDQILNQYNQFLAEMHLHVHHAQQPINQNLSLCLRVLHLVYLEYVLWMKGKILKTVSEITKMKQICIVW